MLIGSDPTIKDYLTLVGLKWFVSKHMANSNSSEFQKELNCSLPISKGHLMITSNLLIISVRNQLFDRCQMTDCPWLSASTPTCSHDSHHQSSHWMPSLSSVRVFHGGRQPHRTCPPSFETARSETFCYGPYNQRAWGWVNTSHMVPFSNYRYPRDKRLRNSWPALGHLASSTCRSKAKPHAVLKTTESFKTSMNVVNWDERDGPKSL